MFHLKPPESKGDVNLGKIDPAEFDVLKSGLLWGIIHSGKVSPGDILHEEDPSMIEFEGSIELTQSAIYRGEVNPTNPAHIEQVQKLIRANSSKPYLPAGGYFLPCHSPDKPAEFELFVLTHNLERKCIDAKNNIYHYDVIGTPDAELAQGAFAELYKIAGTIKPEFSVFGDIIFSPGAEKRLRRVQSSSADRQTVRSFATRLKSEMSVMRQLSYFKLRDEKYYHQTDDFTEHDEDYFRELDATGYVYHAASIEHFHGWTLHELFSWEEIKKRANQKTKDAAQAAESPLKQVMRDFLLSFEGRLLLMIAIKRELKTQFQSRNLLHYDLSLKNIFVEFDEKTFQVQIKLLDCSTAHKYGAELENNDEDLGAYIYRSPERLYGDYNSLKADSYSTAVIDCELLGSERIALQYPCSIGGFIKQRKKEASLPCRLFHTMRRVKSDDEDSLPHDMFESLSCAPVDDNLNDNIQKYIKRATLNDTQQDEAIDDTQQRLSLGKAIEELQLILRQYYVSCSVDKELQRRVSQAHTLGCDLQQALYCKIKLKDNETLVIEQIQKLYDHPACISAFVMGLGFTPFMQCQNQRDLIKATQQLYKDFHVQLKFCATQADMLRHQYILLGAYPGRFNPETAKEMKLYHQRFIKYRNKVVGFECRYDNLAKHTAYFMRKGEKFRALAARFAKGIAAQVVKQADTCDEHQGELHVSFGAGKKF